MFACCFAANKFHCQTFTDSVTDEKKKRNKIGKYQSDFLNLMKCIHSCVFKHVQKKVCVPVHVSVHVST